MKKFTESGNKLLYNKFKQSCYKTISTVCNSLLNITLDTFGDYHHLLWENDTSPFKFNDTGLPMFFY